MNQQHTNPPNPQPPRARHGTPLTPPWLGNTCHRESPSTSERRVRRVRAVARVSRINPDL